MLYCHLNSPDIKPAAVHPYQPPCCIVFPACASFPELPCWNDQGTLRRCVNLHALAPFSPVRLLSYLPCCTVRLVCTPLRLLRCMPLLPVHPPLRLHCCIAIITCAILLCTCLVALPVLPVHPPLHLHCCIAFVTCSTSFAPALLDCFPYLCILLAPALLHC